MRCAAVQPGGGGPPSRAPPVVYLRCVALTPGLVQASCCMRPPGMPPAPCAGGCPLAGFGSFHQQYWLDGERPVGWASDDGGMLAHGGTPPACALRLLVCPLHGHPASSPLWPWPVHDGMLSVLSMLRPEQAGWWRWAWWTCCRAAFLPSTYSGTQVSFHCIRCSLSALVGPGRAALVLSSPVLICSWHAVFTSAAPVGAGAIALPAAAALRARRASVDEEGGHLLGLLRVSRRRRPVCSHVLLLGQTSPPCSCSNCAPLAPCPCA